MCGLIPPFARVWLRLARFAGQAVRPYLRRCGLQPPFRRRNPVEVFVLGGDVEGKGFEIVQRGDALPVEKFAEVSYFDVTLARAANMDLIARLVFRREVVQFLGVFLKAERALDTLGPERRPAVRTRMQPLSPLVDVPALVA